MVLTEVTSHCHSLEPSLLHAWCLTYHTANPVLAVLYLKCDVIIMEKFHCYHIFLFILDELHSLFIFCRSVQSWSACGCSLLHWQPVGGYKPYRESWSMERCDSALAGLFNVPHQFYKLECVSSKKRIK